MDDQRKTSALTLAALQARGLGLGPVAGLLVSILSHLASQVPHLAWRLRIGLFAHLLVFERWVALAPIGCSENSVRLSVSPVELRSHP